MKISVIIPTRERAQYLKYALQTALAIRDEHIEIIVSDNASTDDTSQVVAQFDDPRLRYIRTTRRVSMRQNFQFALDHATGDYVVFFGDDDGIFPRQFPMLRSILERERPDGLSWSLPTYGWPAKDHLNRPSGVRFRRKTSYGQIEQIDVAARKVATESCNLRNFNYYPRLYHGAASKDYLERCANRDGDFFCGSIPDVYFCYRACQVGGKFLFSYHPFSLNGYSPASTGGSIGSVSNEGSRPKSAHAFNQENATDPLADVIPASISIAAALFATLETISERFSEPKFNTDYRSWYGYVLNDVARKSPEIEQQVKAVLKAHAAKTGTETELANPIVGAQNSGKTPADRWAQLVDNITSMRISADADGKNNILTAVNMCDSVLGNDYAKVLDGSISPSQAWRGLRRNARQFKRTL